MSHHATGRFYGTSENLHTYLCRECGIPFSVSEGFRNTGRTIYCPAGHPSRSEPNGPEGSNEWRLLWLRRSANVHVEVSGRICAPQRHRVSTMRSLQASDIEGPHQVCKWCVNRLRSWGKLEDFRDHLTAAGVDFSEFVGWSP